MYMIYKMSRKLFSLKKAKLR